MGYIWEIIGLAAGIAYLTYSRWPEKPSPRCKVCGRLSEYPVCGPSCQARLDMIIVRPEEEDITQWNKDVFGF
jgi:hypothetical protein